MRNGFATARESVDAALARIDRRNPEINAFTAILHDRARARADRLDAARARGERMGPLAGVPFAVKNLYDVAGIPTLAGSKINLDRPPAARDAFLVRQMEAAGAILVGALNMGEYAYDFTGENAHYGPSRNPHDPTRISGGSSGGSGAAVAAGMVPIALGSDTNGSIRVPSSMCGVFGLKPTYGRLSRNGAFLFAASFDHLGPLALSTADLAAAYDAMQGVDASDPAQSAREMEPAGDALDDGIGGLRLAVADDYFARGAEPVAFEAVARVADALGIKRRITIPEAARARAAGFVITAVEGANLHAARLKARPDDFDPATRDRFFTGLMIPGHWYAQAQRFRRWYRDQVARLFDDVDVIIAPSAPCTAPALGQKMMTLAGVEMPVRANLGVFTQPISFIGLPVVAAPLPKAPGMPIGVQIIAAPWREDLALCVSAALERAGVVASWPVPG